MVDNLIRLFESTAINFSTNGIGSLPDAISCVITEERNGEFELEMDYPVNGIRYDEITHRRIVVAKPNQYADPQPFRIYAISKPINGVITVNAAHISYDLSFYTVGPFTAINVTNALVELRNSMDRGNPFSFTTNKITTGNINITKPMTARSVLGGTEGSILDIYHGEYEFDVFNVKLWENRGEDRGVVISYGKNLTDLKQDENCNNVYTSVRPYWYREGTDSNSGLVVLPEKIITFVPYTEANYTKIMPLDLTEQFENKPSVNQLRNAANSYINSHDLDKPTVSIDVSFVQLSDSKEYDSVVLMEEVHLCDTVTVEFPMMGVSAKAKCVKTIFDVITQKYTSIELGDARSNLVTTVTDTAKAAEESVKTSAMELAINNATELITGNLGGYVILHDSNNDGKPDELLIMNTEDIETATKIWRWNNSGLGYSSSGYEGPYGLAMTANGSIVADFITTGTLNANLIKTGSISDAAGNSVINMADGSAIMRDFYGKGSITLKDWNGLYNQGRLINVGDNLEGTRLELFSGRNEKIGAQMDSWNSVGSMRLYNGSNVESVYIEGYDGSITLKNNNAAINMNNSNNKNIIDLDVNDKHIWMKDGNDHNRIELYSTGGQISLINNSNVGSISLTGSNGVISCTRCDETSSRKAKENIKPMDKDEAYKILDLEAVSFDFKEKEYGSNQRGFIAEDVEEILPNLVTPETDGRLAALSYTGMIPYLQTVIKDQEKRIQALEEKINKLLEE